MPWLVARSDLARFNPATSSGGWPQLRFTLLGVTATFAFDFVAHPEEKLLGLQFDEPAGADIDEAFRTNAAALRAHLGEPNVVDHPEFHHLMWRDSRVWVNYSAGVPDREDAARRHRLSVHFHAGQPRAWVSEHDWPLAQVKRLLNRMPEVEVVEVVGRPSFTTIGLTVRSFASLGSLAAATRAANVRFGVGIDEYRVANEEMDASDPAALLFRLGVPRLAEQGDPNTMQVLGIYLAGSLQSHGILSADADSATQLRDTLNPYADQDAHTDSDA